ncbi:MAG: MHS family MFS transporter [Fimbriimonadaceae bacterium]|nr:MHS family MFS transporter [Fimbriimonadaceae bacterium]
MDADTSKEQQRSLWRVIAASSAGTLIEWYDFYIFGSLATIIATQFFPKGNPTVALLSTLAIFATGFVVRPFGALVFGRIGDVVGRKTAFLVTLLIMGVSTFSIGLVPSFELVGVAAPLLVLLLRLAQGLALGGEYGGAATYVAEHAPDERRGFYTSFIQTTATLGLLLSIGVILGLQVGLGEAAFETWGWRVPFLLSAVLVVFSYFIRRKLQESPLFLEVAARGQRSQNPLRDSFVEPVNRRFVLLALFGATMGQGVVWYTGQFYALYFLQTELKVDKVVANTVIAIALVLATPLFVAFGALSDKVGRKWIIVSGMALAAVAYVPLYVAMAANSGATLSIPALVALVFVQVVFVTMVYGPIAALLVELFPTKIRYTSMSLPYHIGNGVFGGLVPLIGTAAVAQSGVQTAGLAYPISVAAICALVGAFLLPDRRGVRLAD